MSQAIPVNLHILDKDYVVACPEEERSLLLASAQYLNEKLQEVRVSGKVVGSERMVVVSALNIIHEYFQYKQRQEEHITSLDASVERLNERLAGALSELPPLAAK